MSRFFKSAAFPILIVVVLAFLAVKLVNPGSTNHHKHSYQTLVTKELPAGEVQSVQFKNKGKVLEVKLKDKESYETGYIDQADWSRTVAVAMGTKNADGKTVITKTPDAAAYTNDYVTKALDALRQQGVDVVGSGFTPLTVTLQPGGN